jgi:diguanylate cyclase (GGDEF)-like protein
VTATTRPVALPAPGARVRSALDAPATPALALAALVAVWALLPAGPVRPAVEVVLFLLAVAAVRRGVRRHRPGAHGAWWGVVAALAAFAGSSAAEVAVLSGQAVVGGALVEPLLDLVGYGALAVAGLVVLVKDRRWQEPEGWLDGVTLVLAAWLTGAAWSGVVGTDGGVHGERAVGFAVLTAVVLVGGARLVVPGEGRSPSGFALCLAGLLTVVDYAAELVAPATQSRGVVPMLPLLAVALVGFAANHPSMARLGHPPVGDRAFASRLVGIGAALLVNPAVVLVWILQHGGELPLAVGVAVLTVIALVRIGRLAVEREQARRALEASEARLRRLAATDPLTGLANRADFLDRLARALAEHDPRRPPALLFVDLDGFKTVNDTHGHPAGDELLVAVAGRLRACLRGDDSVARLGGDEFAVLLLDDAASGRAGQIAQRILAALREPVALDGASVVVTGSVGGVHARAGDTPAGLLRRADSAMYEAKRQGKDSYELLGPA